MGLRISYTGGVTIRPEFGDIRSMSFSSESRNIAHDILDGDPVFTLRPAAPATGTLVLHFDTAADALTCESVHRLATIFTIVDDDQPRLRFRYAVTGRVTLTLDEATGKTWIVEVEYQVVPS